MCECVHQLMGEDGHENVSVETELGFFLPYNSPVLVCKCMGSVHWIARLSEGNWAWKPHVWLSGMVTK